jgi:hypothetical protein
MSALGQQQSVVIVSRELLLTANRVATSTGRSLKIIQRSRFERLLSPGAVVQINKNK